MPLHPEIKRYLDSLPSSGGEPPSPKKQRKQLNKLIVPLDERSSIHAVEDLIIPTKEYDIPIRIYTPKEQLGPYPLLVFFHGGGWIIGSVETHDEKVRRIALASGYKVISVDYRLAPEHPFPAALNDCYAATKWVSENVQKLNGDPSRVAVAGDSAGGNLAAAVTLMSRDQNGPKISKQVLIYPAIDFSDAYHYPSINENGEGYGLDLKKEDRRAHPYLKRKEDALNPYASPIRAQNLNSLPSALIITAEYDPLRDEGELYAVKLNEADVQVETKRYNGAIHGFLRRFTDIDEYKDVYNLIGAFLNK